MPPSPPAAPGAGPARRPSPVPRDPSAVRSPAPRVRRRTALERPAPPPPSPLARYHAQLLARRRLRALAAMTGGLGSAALLALTGGTLPTAGAVPVATEGVLDPQAWVLPEDAGMGPLVIPTIGALPAGAEDWFLPGAPAAAVTSLRQAARPAARDLDADLEAEFGLERDPAPPAAPAPRTTAPSPSPAVADGSGDVAVAPPARPAPPSGATLPTPAPAPTPASTPAPSGPSSSVQPSPAVPTPAPAPSGPSSSVQPSPSNTPPAPTLPPADPTPADPTPADPTPADPTPADPSPTGEPPPTEEPPPAPEPPVEPPPAEPEPAPAPALAAGAAASVLDPATGTAALSVALEQVVAGASCADASVVAGNGTLVAVRLTVTTGADLAVLGGGHGISPVDFRLVADDGSVLSGGAPAGVCDTGAAAFPAAPLAPSSSVTGTVVLDVPARSGTVVFRPAWLP